MVNMVCIMVIVKVLKISRFFKYGFVLDRIVVFNVKRKWWRESGIKSVCDVFGFEVWLSMVLLIEIDYIGNGS